jgi:hypothetical protein
MKIYPIRDLALTLAAALLIPSVGGGQWLTHPTLGIPRTADGKPNLSGPTPRTADGRPDLSGLWHAGPKYDSDFKAADAHSWAQAKVRERDANPAADSWSTLCLPPGPMINFSPLKIIQTPQRIPVPAANGISLPCGVGIAGKGSAVHEDLPEVVRHFVQNGHDMWG